MIGHEPLIRMRMAGRKPGVVFINDFPCKTDWAEYGDHVTISVARDVIQTLDMRFLVGLRVSISGCTEERAKALLEKAKESGAVEIGACHSWIDGQKARSGWCEIYKREMVNG